MFQGMGRAQKAFLNEAFFWFNGGGYLGRGRAGPTYTVKVVSSQASQRNRRLLTSPHEGLRPSGLEGRFDDRLGTNASHGNTVNCRESLSSQKVSWGPRAVANGPAQPLRGDFRIEEGYSLIHFLPNGLRSTGFVPANHAHVFH